ncbi:MAG: hypothetical protein ACNA8W_09990, partial [Bradymonadaceae bacterium]
SRGQCNPSNGECVNAPVCNRSNEATACVEGFYCLDDACATEADICASLDCGSKRGVCDAAARACTNATNCESDDMNCEAGFFCNAQNSCQANRCDAAGECERGVCERASGQCVNPDSCNVASDCVDGNYCIDGSCQETVAACAVCTGNQVCDYDEAAQSVSCSESAEGCRNALDCLDDRSCRLGACVEPTACESDNHEPNDTMEEAVNLNQALGDGLLQATLCSSDVDYYSYNTAGHGHIRGTFVVEARIHGEDVGHGDLVVEVLNAAGDILASGAADSRGTVALQLPMNATQIGTYYVRIQDSGDVSTAGLRYSLYADFVSNLLAEACNEAQLLTPGEVSGNTRESDSYQLHPSCTESPNTAYEDIYRFELTQRSFVELVGIPAADAEITLSVRQSCFSNRSEVACENSGLIGVRERVSVQLDPGQYFVIVKGPRANTGGGYSLQFNTTPIICEPGYAYCDASERSVVCNVGGSAFETSSCPMDCDNDTGRCARVQGDACYAAIDASSGYSGMIDWGHFINEYEEQPDECIPEPTGNNPKIKLNTSGPDVAFVADVPPGQYIHAELDTLGDYAALYIVTDCGDVADSCIDAALDAPRLVVGPYRRTVIWQNESEQTQQVYVIANSDGEKITGYGHINIIVGERICEPASTRCEPQGVSSCNASGTRYGFSHECPYGCDGTSTVCETPRNDICKGAVDIVGDGGVFRAGIQDYTTQYDPGQHTCLYEGGISRTAPGKDATFYVDAKAGEVITARLVSEFRSSLYIVTSCADVGGSCVAGSYSGVNEIDQLVYVAPADDRYFIIVDSSANNLSGPFELQVSVDLGMCPPDSFQGCLDDQALGYCTSEGAVVSHRCVDGCVGGACGTARGDICYDAISVSAGEIVSDYFKGSVFHEMPEGDVGSCNFSDGVAGGDTYYAVDLKDGEVLHVSGSVSGAAALLYILEDCGDKSSCVDNTFGGEADLVYRAQEDRTIYVVAARTSRSLVPQYYTLQFNVFEGECQIGETRCADGQTMEYCGGLASFEPYPCLTGGCFEGVCANPRGDVCADALALENNQFVTGSRGAIDAVNLPRNRKAGECEAGTSGTPGSDTIYSFDAVAGQRATVDYRSGSGATRVYVMRDCNRRNSCLVFDRPELNNDDGVLTYDVDVDGTYFLVIDSSSNTANDDYSFFFSLQEPGSCAAGETTCMEPDLLGVCDADGVYQGYRCENGCTAGRCDSPRGGRCEDARALVLGESVTGDFNGDSTVEFDVESAGLCDFGSVTELFGRDTVYAVDIGAGELAQFHLDSRDSSSFMYILGECGAGTSCLGNTGPDYDGRLEYYAEENETIYVVVTRDRARRSTLQYTLHTYSQVPGCSPGEQVCYDDGKTLGFCDDTGVLQPSPCDGECYIDACLVPAGDFCGDVISLADGDEVTGRWDGFNTLSASGTHGECDFSIGSLGRERIYAIEIPAGQVLRAALTTSHNGATMYFLEECGEVDTCLAISSERGAQVLDYLSMETKTYYLVVDSNNRNISATQPQSFRLNVSYQTPECIPGDRQCGQGGGAVEVCNRYGVFDEPYSCLSGSCQDGWCQGADGDICDEPILITSSTQVSGHFNTPRTNSIQFPNSGTIGECTIAGQTTGRETVYAVILNEGDVLTASSTISPASTLNRLYLLTACGVGDSCKDFSAGATSVVRYVAPVDQVVYVVADSAVTSSAQYSFDMDIDIRAPECTPGAFTCSAQGHIDECTAEGVWALYLECAGGCADGRCTDPKGDVCHDAIPLVSGVA